MLKFCKRQSNGKQREALHLSPLRYIDEMKEKKTINKIYFNCVASIALTKHWKGREALNLKQREGEEH
jgi:hypothetical protein